MVQELKYGPGTSLVTRWFKVLISERNPLLWSMQLKHLINHRQDKHLFLFIIYDLLLLSINV